MHIYRYASFVCLPTNTYNIHVHKHHSEMSTTLMRVTTPSKILYKPQVSACVSSNRCRKIQQGFFYYKILLYVIITFFFFFIFCGNSRKTNDWKNFKNITQEWPGTNELLEHLQNEEEKKKNYIQVMKFWSMKMTGN